jgi:hypothetical protein
MVVVTLVALSGGAFAQEPLQPQPEPAPPPVSPYMTPPDATAPTTATMAPDAPYSTDAQIAAASAEADKKPKQPKRGDFDAGGQVRLPSGPDEDGKFATFNWVAVDLKGRYFLLDSVSVNGSIPIALIKPDTVGGTIEPSMFGGIMLTLDAKLPKGPFSPKKYDTDIGLLLSGGTMREGAMLLSDKDYPLFAGDFKFGFSTGLRAKIKLSSLLDFSMTPLFVYQDGSNEAADAIQIPMSIIIGLGETLKLSADTGVFTGDDLSFKGKNGGRISAGGSLTVKLGPIMAHAGAGVASLLTGGLYPTVKDSFYVDLDVKYVK